MIASAEKSGFAPPEVAMLKDTASVCFEVIHSEGSLLLLPLHLRGRYPEGPPAPFGSSR